MDFLFALPGVGDALFMKKKSGRRDSRHHQRKLTFVSRCGSSQSMNLAGINVLVLWCVQVNAPNSDVQHHDHPP
jgi:hypothetical protein